MKLIYWQDEVIHKIREGSGNLVFVPNLCFFLYNNKEIEIKDGFAKVNHDGSLTYESAVSLDGQTEYRQVVGIESKEDLLNWSKALNTSLSYIKRDLSYVSFLWAKRKSNEDYAADTFNWRGPQLCSHNPELFWAFNSALFQGYYFNYTDPNEVYYNTYYYDSSSFHSAIMYYKKFPFMFISQDKDTFNSLYKEGSNFYGKFLIKLKNFNTYLYHYGSSYDCLNNTLSIWANDLDIEFLKRLVGIEWINCERLYKVRLERLNLKLRTAIATTYLRKENSPKGSNSKKHYKNILERISGLHQTRKTYKTKAIWDSKEREFKKISIEKKDSWEEIQERLYNSPEYSVGVWIHSYARLILLEVDQLVEGDSLYGDTDSIIFCGESHISEIQNYLKENHFPEISPDFNLGNFKKEADCFQLKVLDRKWYCYSEVSEDGEFDIEVKCSGAKPEIVKNFLLELDNPVEGFSKDFPDNVRPYVAIKKENDLMEYYFTNYKEE